MPLACAQPSPRTSIRAVLDEQVAAWNQSDIEAFMQGYWQSDELVFESANQITNGWQATLDGYQKRYPNRAAMGTLTFSKLVVDVTDAHTATVTGSFHLERNSQPPASGHFVLTFRKLEDGWRIVRDRTWSDAPFDS